MSKFRIMTYLLTEEGNTGILTTPNDVVPDNHTVTGTEIIYRVGGGTSLRVTYLVNEED